MTILFIYLFIFFHIKMTATNMKIDRVGSMKAACVQISEIFAVFFFYETTIIKIQ